MASTAANAGDGWKTYRNEAFGYELSYPAEMTYRAYLDGSSGDLLDATTGDTLIAFEVWPPGEYPRERAPVSAKELGIERAKAVTQADGPDGSSYCGEPVTVREDAALQGAHFYEVSLTCRRESYPDSHDDTVDSDPDPSPLEAPPVITSEGMKGPTYVVDISPAWRTRILLADPVGVDPRMQDTKRKIDHSVLRKILWTLKTFPSQKPPGVCIEDLQHRGVAITNPPR